MCLSAQQTAQYSLYMFDKYQYNPAYGGLDYSLSANVHTRSQWQGLDKSPTSIVFNAHMPFYIWSGSVGMQVTSRGLGVLHHRTVTGSYNYVLNLGNGLWSNGARVGLSHLGVDGSAIVTPEGIYTGGSVNHRDPILPNSNTSGLGLQWEVGSYYRTEDLDIGASIGSLPGTDIGLSTFTFDKVIHATAYAEYRFEIFGEYDVMQSILLKSDLNNVQTDITSIIRINGNVFGGLGVRGYSSTSLDAVTVILGAQVNKHVTLVYSYDAGISGLRNVNDGSHELLLNYNLQKAIGTGLPPKIIYNPRYL